MELFKLFGTVAVNTTDAITGIDETVEKAESAKTKIGSAFSKAGTTISGIGKKLLPVTAAIGGVGLAATKASLTFEDAMAKVSTIADTTQVPLSDLEKGIKDLSNQTGISSAEIAQNVYDAISAGQQTGDAVNFVSNSTKLARAGFAEAGDALDILTTIMNAYGLEAEDVTRVSDVLIQTQNLGKTTVGELSSAMGKVIPTAKANNVALEQVASGYAIMTANGVATAETTTYMNSMLNELGKSGTNVADLLKQRTGQSFSELMESGLSLADVLQIVSDGAEEQGLAFSDMWGSAEAGKAGLILLGDGVEDFNATLDQMKDSTGATDEAFDKLNTNSYTIQKALNQAKNAAIDLGDAIMQSAGPMIEKLAGKVEQAAKWFSGLSDSQKETIVKVGAVVAAIGPALLIFGKIASAIGSVVSLFGMLNSTVLIVVAAIAAVIAIGVALYKNWDTIKEYASGLMDAIFNAWEGIKTSISDAWENIKQTTQSVWEAVSGVVSGAWETIKNIVSVGVMLLGEIINAAVTIITLPFQFIWENCKETLIAAWNVISTTVSSALDAISAVISSVFSVISGVVSTVWNAISSTISSVLSAIYSVISSVWNSISSTISSVASTIWSNVTRIFENIRTAIANKINSAKDTVSSVFETIKSTISDNVNAAKETVSSVFDGIKSAISDKINEAKDTVSSVIESIKGLFDFEWHLPELKLPHISISGSFSLNPPSVPHFGLEWYKNGGILEGILNGPTMFGMNPATGNAMIGGEAGKEAVTPIDKLQGYVSAAVAEQNAALINILELILRAIYAMDEAMTEKFRTALEGMGLDINNREFARLVKAVK